MKINQKILQAPFQAIRKLDVFRRLSSGEEVFVGQLAQNVQSVYFQYDANYLAAYHSLSPFNLPFNNALSEAPKIPHHGLHGVFSDSLPDGWGMLLMDRIFQQHGISPQQLTPMDRLAYIGDRGMGALSYKPSSDYIPQQTDFNQLYQLGQHATQIFDGQKEQVLAALANAGGSGGARPKALVYLNSNDPDTISTSPQVGLEPWLIKFTSQNLLLGHEEGRCEAAYLKMAADAGIDVTDWQLFETEKFETEKSKAWLLVRRFDCHSKNNSGRYHQHSLCGLLDADYRQPSMDYEDIIKASQVLCNNPAIGKKLFTRAIFNLFAANQDDHSKNWSFIMSDNGQWQLSPFYDITFSPTPYNEHSTSFMGYGKEPPLKVIQKLAKQANFKNWQEAKQQISEVVEALSHWTAIANDLDISRGIQKLISSQLNITWKQNKHLLS